MGKSLTRRNFVKAAAAVAAGTASACALTSCQPSGTSNLEVDENVAANLPIWARSSTAPALGPVRSASTAYSRETAT